MLNDVRYALRMLRRTPGFTAAAVLTLALGIGANTAIYSVLQAVWIDAVPFADPSRLVIVASANEKWSTMAVSEEDFAEWRAQNHVFESLGAADTGGGSLGFDNGRLTPRWASADLFATLGARMHLGRPLLASDSLPAAPLVAVLSFEAWQRRFASDPGAIGRRLESPAGPVEIVGVTPPDFKLSSYLPPAWVARKLTTQPSRGGRSLEVVGRLKPGVTLTEAHTGMNAIAARLAVGHAPGNAYPGATLTPIRARLAGPGVGDSLWLLLASTGVVLLIACTNIANLFLVRAANRRRELSVRVALGARTAHIVRQILCESSLVAAAGTAAGLLLTLWARDAIVASMPVLVHRGEAIAVDGRVLAFSVAVGAVTALLTGLLPVLRASGARAADLTAGGNSHAATPARRGITSTLVGLEVALAVVVLSAAALLVSSFVKLRGVDPGFTPRQILTFAVTPEAGGGSGEGGSILHRRILDALSALPQVEAASAGEMLPLSGNRSAMPFRVADGSNEDRLVSLDTRYVAPGYIEAMRIPVKEGQAFSPVGDPPGGVLVNERAARELWPGAESVVGRRLMSVGDGEVVLGVIGDVLHVGLDREPVAEIYRRASQLDMTYVVRTSGPPLALVQAVRTTVEAAAPVKVADVRTLDEMVEQSVRLPNFRARLFGLMGLLVAALAAMGVFSVTAGAVADRRREIGIRTALGATERRTVGLMMGQTSVPLGAGVLAGLTIAFNTNQLVAHFLYATAPIDPPAIAAVVTAVVGIGWLAAYIPARRALRVDPTVVLREE